MKPPRIIPILTDPEEMAIASMDTEELIAELWASAGAWANRPDDIARVLATRQEDRIDELYANIPDDTEPPV